MWQEFRMHYEKMQKLIISNHIDNLFLQVQKPFLKGIFEFYDFDQFSINISQSNCREVKSFLVEL